MAAREIFLNASYFFLVVGLISYVATEPGKWGRKKEREIVHSLGQDKDSKEFMKPIQERDRFLQLIKLLIIIGLISLVLGLII